MPASSKSCKLVLPRHGVLIALLLSFCAAQASSACEIKISVQTPYGAASALRSWTATFEQYLTEQLHSALGCTFKLIPLPNPDAAYTLVADNQTDFLLVNSGLTHCVQLNTDIAPVAALVNVVDGMTTTIVGGCIFALANRTNITSLRDLVNMKISLGVFSDLSAFEIQSIAQTHTGVSILGEALQLQFSQNSQVGLQDVPSGDADVALGRADITSDMVAAQMISSRDIFKCLTPAPDDSGMVPGYPFPITTSPWPELALSAHPNTNQSVRKAVAEALFRITSDSYPAKAGDYSSWVPPYSNAGMAQMEERVGYIPNGTCLRNATLHELLLCPPGQESLPVEELAAHCEELGITCPHNHTCFCKPCRKKQTLSVYHQYGLVGATAFTIIMAVVPTTVVIGSLSLCLYFFQRHSRNKQLLPAFLPYSELHISADSTVLLQGTFGLYLKGTYCGMAVAVGRIMAPSTTLKSVFGLTAKQYAHQLNAAGVVTNKGQPRRASASRGRTREKSSPLLESQGPLLANYSHSFIEQLRNASLPYANSSAGLKRQLPLEGKSRLRRMWVWLQLTVKKRMPWGEAAAQRKRKLTVLRFIAERMALRHPNLLTVLGVSAEPITEDPLLVVVYPETGVLKAVLQNETVEFETEMVVAIMKDVASALKYLHQLEPHALAKDITSAGVLLNADYGAQLAHMHLAMGLEEQEGLHEVPPYWKAPELLKHGLHTMATDVYAFGMLLYEVLFRREPFAGESSEEVLHALCDKNRKLPKRPSLAAPHGKHLPVELVTLMQQCWHQDPEKRPQVTQVKDALLEFARLHFNNQSPAEAMALKHTKERALLDQILPPKVSAALREGRPVEPESFDCVTIFFSDIVGFETMSTELPPQEVLSMLDRLYRAFDVLTSKHNLFKVETIGDSYMVVGNLRCPQPDHAARVANFAIEAVQTAGSILISESNPDMGYLSIRAGFHSGPVVASVVGTTNPRYCLFGDTVNVASRMESSSIANRIHITSVAAELIATHAPELKRQLVHRRMQQIKGKGVMRTFWLELSPDHLVQSSLDTPDISAHSSPHSTRTPSQATQAPPILPALRSSAPQGADLGSHVRNSPESWSADGHVGSRLSSVSVPAQVVQATVVSELQSPGADFKDPIPARWPPQHFEGPAV